ncbi:hypothetical protein DCW30_05640 [Streptomyces alfalfae]|uniref:Uncharacterized protein n=1 Tax=Streptomyces alfalfae TaxID=1642299 RepID=A0ABM6GYC1_9ACTN|nr:hypothetical protein [Streptomyces alfalfae]APY88216.1 hypothetical protein A7J05_23235 [Streptomyces alfalfae]AYA18612.1 hypothetical protein D3X13_22345 [Streptomyces fradiae]RXX46508.1 hypothetical protein DCW30_05640 [Streptomyces alfalfae]RZM90021.1 hypothetical protein D4104_25575 [Streptomyces alfalfae]
MWGKRKRRITELEAHVRQLVDERDEARTASAAHLAAAVRTAGRNTILAERNEQLTATEHSHDADMEIQADRIERLLKACVRYRAELATAARDIARLQDRLDDCLGLTAPEVEAGAGWQKRRQDLTDRSVV